MGFCNCSMFCCTLLYVPSSFAIILMGKRELVALLSLSSWCLVIVLWLFLAVPWVCLQFVIVVFPDHSHLFLKNSKHLIFTCVALVKAGLVVGPIRPSVSPSVRPQHFMGTKFVLYVTPKVFISFHSTFALYFV